MTTPLINIMTTPRYDPAYLAWNTVASYDTADDARSAIDKLADRGFPIEHLDIVGSDVKVIDRVTGRLTGARAARAGALSGMWTGMFVGVLMALFAPVGAAAWMILAGLAIGAASGAAVTTLATRASGARAGRYTSVRTLVAGRYDLVARNGHAEQARVALAPEQPVTL